jgi:hypothetical protein
MALGIGYGLPFVAQHGTNPYKTQWAAALEGAKGAGATVEDENAGTGSCLVARGQEAYTDGLPATPSLLIVPQFYKAGNLYQDVPPFVAEDSTMRFAVSRNTTATRVNSSGLIESVASGVPRIDWLGQSCPGLLVEPSASNGILNSTDTTTNWTCWSGFTSGVIDVLGVSGVNLQVNTSGSNIGAGTGNGNIARTNNNVALASGSTYTLSFFIKKTGAHTIGGYYASITGAASGDLGGGFNVSGSFSSGSIYNTAGTTNRIRRVEQWGTDVYRCSETFTMTASGTLTTFRLAPVSGVTLASLAAVGTELGFAAPQIELSSVPTTFIPTTTAAVSRAADTISASGALVSGLIGQTEGTIYAEVDVRAFASSAARRIVNMRVDGNNLLSLEINSAGTSIEFVATSGGVAVTTTASGLTSGIQKIAVGYNSAASGTALYVNGTLRDTKTIAIPSLASVVFGLGVRADGGAGTQLNDRLRAAAIYTTRLSNDQLANITRLT